MDPGSRWSPGAFLVFLSLLLLPLASPAAALTVVVDPGHGGDRNGAIGPRGQREKDIALSISLALEAELKARGHKVILTRREDVSLGLAERVEIANRSRADLFLSIHANSMPTAEARARVHGVETYFLSAEASDEAAAALAHLENADDGGSGDGPVAKPLERILADLARSEAHVHSSRLAYELQDWLVQGAGARNRGVKQAPFVVLEGASMPAVLVEVGYVSHPKEGRRLADPAHQGRIAGAIASGIDSFFHQVLEKKAPGVVGGGGLKVPPVQRIE